MIFKNSNKAPEMAQICDKIQRDYVPSDQKQNKVLEKVIFDGDQLTEERARNASWANVLADNEIERLEGLEPSFADWHLKKNMYQVHKSTALQMIILKSMVRDVVKTSTLGWGRGGGGGGGGGGGLGYQASMWLWM
jgi:hypothetical protein